MSFEYSERLKREVAQARAAQRERNRLELIEMALPALRVIGALAFGAAMGAIFAFLI